MTKPLIIFSGGGTLGSVVPLLSLAENLRDDYRLLWLGSEFGPERQLVEEAGLEFKVIAAGKWRRYWSWDNLRDIGRVAKGFYQSWRLLMNDRPVLLISAGSFVSVPTAWAAALLRVKILVHQLDRRAGLANKLMAPLASVVAVTWRQSLADFGAKARWTGSMATADKTQDKAAVLASWQLPTDKPVVLVMGGGTGSEALNRLAIGLSQLATDYCLIHVSGPGKQQGESGQDYKAFALLNRRDMAAALTVADVVVSRAGMGAILDLAAWRKPAIIVPMPNSHQEDNAALLAEAGAALVLQQASLSPASLHQAIKKLLDQPAEQLSMTAALAAAVKLDSGELPKLARSLAEA